MQQMLSSMKPGSNPFVMPAARVAMRPLFLLALSALTTLHRRLRRRWGWRRRWRHRRRPGNPCGETARKQWVLNVTREWYLFPGPAAGRGGHRVVPDGGGPARCIDRDGPRAGQGSLLQLPDDEVRRGLAARRRPVRRLRLPLTHRHRQSAVHPRRVRRQPGGGGGPAARRRGRSPSTRAAASCPFRNRWRTAPPVHRPAWSRRRGRPARPAPAAQRPDASTMQLTKRTVTIDPVPDSFGTRVLPVAGTTGVGYLHLRSYISTADPQLRTAFQAFRAQDVRDFIIDLRYNGGGLVSTAELIDNLLGGDRTSADIQYTIVHSPSKVGAELHRSLPAASAIGAAGAHRVPDDRCDRLGERDQHQRHARLGRSGDRRQRHVRQARRPARVRPRERLPGPAAARHVQDGQCERRRRLLRRARVEHAFRVRGERHARRPDGRPRGRPDAGGAAVDQHRCLRQRDQRVRRRTGQDAARRAGTRCRGNRLPPNAGCPASSEPARASSRARHST